MNARRIKIMECLLILACAAGCVTTSDVVRAKADGKGTSRVYHLNVNKAWEIARAAFRFEGPAVVEEHGSEGYMVATIGESLISWGAVVGVWIEPVGDESSRVTVVIKRRNPTELSVPLTEPDFHDNFLLAWWMNLKKPEAKP